MEAGAPQPQAPQVVCLQDVVRAVVHASARDLHAVAQAHAQHVYDPRTATGTALPPH